MSNRFKGSPYRRRHDLESSGGRSTDFDRDDDYESSSPFNIRSTKNASMDRLRRWRQAALVLNASRRFRYTLDLKKEEEKKQILRKIRAHAQAIRAAYLFKEAGLRVNGSGDTHQTLTGEFTVSPEQLSTVTRDHNIAALQELGGVKGIAEALKTNPEKGIVGDDADLMKRRNAFGSNTYPQRKGRSFWMFLWEAWQDLTLIILMVAAAASLALGIKTEGIKKGWYDGVSIAFAVILVIVVTAISDYRQSLQFQNLNEEKRNIHLEVIRGGRRVDVSIYDIVVGDVIPLNIGDQVPADGVLIAGHSLAIDESSMTGESKIVNKNTSEPFLMSGCKVADGSGAMLVTGVGINTEWGLLMASISEDTGEETPLQVRLNGVATFIGIVGLSVAVLVLVVLVIRFFTGHTKNPDGSVQFRAGHTSVSAAVDGAIKIFTVAVTIVVVAVPEGLPLAVTLTLAYSMRKMMRDKALVRRLSACETMGSATTICSDKTGTLTLNEMTVVDAFVGGKKLECADNKTELSGTVCSLIIEGVAQNTNGSVFVPEGGGDVEVSGSPTEKAILVWALKLGMNFEAVRSESTLIHVFPFNSEKKRGGVALQLPDSQVHIHWKGAAEIVLACCTWYIDQSGDAVAMSEDKAAFFKEGIEDMAARSLRCVAIAYRSYEREKVPADEQQLMQWSLPEDDLVLLAIVGLKDPCRPGVKDAVRLCQKAGVKVRMVTGDNLQTAKAIALECGILGSDDDAVEPNLIEGKTFRAYSDEQREEIAEKISVMGRSSPNDKLLLVQALRKRGHVVAVTGDGTNDAPALHEADIGLSMGIQGTEVAKENSDIIILDDNFASVVKVVRWGRSVYANIQKFIQFQLTVNVAALIINVVAAISSGDVPLNAVQLLWVNLIMDTLGALALATEPPTDHLMDRPPVGRREPLITNIMWRNLLIQAAYQVSVLLTLNFQGKKLLGLQHDNPDHANKVKNTLIFNAFVLCQIFNEFNARKPDEKNIFRGVTKNHLFIAIVGVTLILQVVIIEFIGKFTSTVKLNWKQWLISVAIAFISWPLAIVGKLIPVSSHLSLILLYSVFSSLAGKPTKMVADNGELPYLHHEHAALDISMDTASHMAGKCFDDDGRPKRTGTLWTASAHVITAVIGSGVLSLAWSTAQLGWIAGPTVLFLFSFVTYYTSTLLAACYRTGDPDTGKRNYTYMDAVQSTLGGFYVKVCGYVQYINLFGVAIGYTIASSISMMAVKRSNCFHRSHGTDPCHMNANPYMVAFGVAEILLSQIPDFDQLSWLSIVAAVMSFTYSSIGLGLGIGKVIGNKEIKGSLTGIGLDVVTPTDKVWRSFQALGGIAFAYSFSNILIEIQDTIKSPPSESKTMKKASLISISVTTFFYMLCGCFGYAAFGDSSPGNLLTGFGFYNPYWLLDIANVAIVIHLVGAYQVFCQPIYAFVEKIAKNKFPDSTFITKEIRIGSYNLNLFRLVWRTLFVITTTVISMMLPFFNSIVGLLGAFGFWPLTVFFPVEMYISQKKIPKWSTRWVSLEILSVACLIISICAAAGSIAEIVEDLKSVKLFHMKY